MTNPAKDSTMDAITDAVRLGHNGDPAAARARLRSLWNELGPTGDPLHRCTLAHYLADLYDDPARAIVWDTRALDAAHALTDERAGWHHPGLRVAGFYPSLHLNLADNYRRLGSFDAAAEHLAAAREFLPELRDDAYGALVRQGIDGVADAIEQRSTTPRPHPAPAD